MQHQQVIQIYTVITKDYSADPFQLLDKAMWKSNRITTGLVSYMHYQVLFQVYHESFTKQNT